MSVFYTLFRFIRDPEMAWQWVAGKEMLSRGAPCGAS